MGLTTLLLKDPAAFLILAIPLLYSIIIHEISHGWTAYFFGDDTALRAGRLSLNPLSHIDPIGTIALFIAGFGWAKPVPIDYTKIGHFRIGLVCISLAGCLANIVIATLAILFLQFRSINSHPLTASIILIIANINITLGALNLIPVPPLDGSRILLGILPPKAQAVLVRIEPYGLAILFGLLFTGLLNPVIMFAQQLIVASIKLVLRI
jgi:Zn-dependent protease